MGELGSEQLGWHHVDDRLGQRQEAVE